MNFAKKKKKGFTLIELLVVIAIIGILAAIVLVSLGGARSKAKDARIQSDISQIRALAEMIQSDLASYAALCDTTDNTLNTALGAHNYITEATTVENDIKTQQGGTLALTCFVGGTPEGYCVEAKLLNGQYNCADSTGVVRTNAAAQCTAAGRDCTP